MLDTLFGGSVSELTLAAALVGVVVVAYLLADIAARLARTLLAVIAGVEGPSAFHSPIVRQPIRITRAVVFAAALVLLAPPALELAGASLPVGLEVAVLTGWVFGSGLRVGVIALLAYLLVRIIASAARRLEDEISHDAATVDVAERIKRARTLSRLIQNGLTVVVMAVAVLMVLRELGVDIMPVLTGAGILGLAVGFGAQTLVKDLISGFFLILENQVRVGDVATINGTGGLVEAINLRTVVLRDLHGTVHVFPNGAIERLSNLTKDYSYYVVDMGVAYKEDTDEVVRVLQEVAAGLAADPKYSVSVLEPLEVLGVDAFADSAVTIKVRIKTIPLKQWEVGRELRRRIKKTFDARGIEIPFPHLSVYVGEASQPFVFRQIGSEGPTAPQPGTSDSSPA